MRIFSKELSIRVYHHDRVQSMSLAKMRGTFLSSEFMQSSRVGNRKEERLRKTRPNKYTVNAKWILPAAMTQHARRARREDKRESPKNE